MDWSDKVEAYNIDEACCRYNNQSTDVQFYPHSAKFEERCGCGSPIGSPSLRRGSSVQFFYSWGGQASGGTPTQVPGTHSSPSQLGFTEGSRTQH